mmetsp:Transcript_33600/g.53881  ORF Transcript_33600/g.53881 Transcript_33600/m.53881 type:complete len:400 (-) Transcript_33600:531-1730(-)
MSVFFVDLASFIGGGKKSRWILHHQSGGDEGEDRGHNDGIRHADAAGGSDTAGNKPGVDRVGDALPLLLGGFKLGAGLLPVHDGHLAGQDVAEVLGASCGRGGALGDAPHLRREVLEHQRGAGDRGLQPVRVLIHCGTRGRRVWADFRMPVRDVAVGAEEHRARLLEASDVESPEHVGFDRGGRATEVGLVDDDVDGVEHRVELSNGVERLLGRSRGLKRGVDVRLETSGLAQLNLVSGERNTITGGSPLGSGADCDPRARLCRGALHGNQSLFRRLVHLLLVGKVQVRLVLLVEEQRQVLDPLGAAQDAAGVAGTIEDDVLVSGRNSRAKRVGPDTRDGGVLSDELSPVCRGGRGARGRARDNHVFLELLQARGVNAPGVHHRNLVEQAEQLHERHGA